MQQSVEEKDEGKGKRESQVRGAEEGGSRTLPADANPVLVYTFPVSLICCHGLGELTWTGRLESG